MRLSWFRSKNIWKFVLPLILAIVQINFSPTKVVLAEPAPEPARPAPVAGITLNVPSQVPIGGSFSFTVTFDNTASNSPGNTGYGPFIDLYFPVTGTDGNDGVDFVNATYLGQALTATELTFPGPGPAGCVNHPYAIAPSTGASLQVCGVPGDKLVVLQLPFGSFTPDQPAINVTVNATLSNLADLNVPLMLRARGGYQFGATPLQDWCCNPFDATILSQPNPDATTWSPSASLFPYIITVAKTYNGPEDETATGPNYPRRYTVTADIANGQTVTGFVLSDVLPSNLQFIQIIGPTTPAGASCTTPGTTTPGGTVSCAFASVTGGSGTADASFTFEFYVPLNDTTPAPVIDATSGDDAQSMNNVTALGSWQPNDSRDPLTPVNVDGIGPEHTLTDKSIAIQKSVSNISNTGPSGYTPGDTLDYTLDFQVSDFFAFQNIIIADIISDGQQFDSSFTPTLTIDGNTYTLTPLGMDPANYTVSQNFTGAVASPPVFTIDPAANDGTSTITFRISDEIVARGETGKMIGGCIPVAGTGGPTPNCDTGNGGYNDGPTTGTIHFRTVIQDQFTDTFPSGDPSVDHGDTLDNNVTIAGDLLSVADANTFTGQSEADTSAASIAIQFGKLTKSLYAINGSTSFSSPLIVRPGDEITYRLRYTLPTSDFETLVISDYLPLPILYVTEITAFDDVGGFGNPVVIPAAGHVNYGPADTFRALAGDGVGCTGGAPIGSPPANADGTPCMSVDSGSNSVSFNYGNYDDPANTDTEIDLLFTTTVSNDPFADGLYLTNQAHAFEGTTNAGTQSLDGIVQVVLSEPALVFGKSVIASDNPNAVYTPALPGSVTFNVPGTVGARWTGNLNSTVLANEGLNSDVSSIEAGDKVSFALVIENKGTSSKGAFDIDIKDVIPAGFSIPAGGLNLRIAYGDNSSTIAYTKPDNSPAVDTDLFASGIRLVDPGGATGGVCQVHSLTSGKNVIIITYDLQVDNNIAPNQTIVNTGTLFNYSGEEGGPDFTTKDLTDDASVTIASPVLDKVLTATGINNAVNSNTQAVIGELVTYTLTLTIPQSITPNAVLTDTLDSGLSFVDIQSVTYSTGVTSGNTIGTGANPAYVAIGNVNGGTGNQLTFNFDSITNPNTDSTVADTITIVYDAVVLNVNGNQNGTLLNNAATFSWGTSNSIAQKTPTANVRVIEPVIAVSKQACDDAVDPCTAVVGLDAGDILTYRIAITASTTNAWDVTLSDLLPAALTSPSIVSVTGAAPADFEIAGGTLQTTAIANVDIASGGSVVIYVQGTLSYAVAPGQTVANTAAARWTSLDGDVNDVSSHNTNSDERTGSGTPAYNDYSTSASSNLTINNIGPVKSLVSTSEAGTSGSDVAIGEIVRFRLAIDLPEGTSNNVIVSDTLQGGLSFIDSSRVKISFIADSAMTLPADLVSADNDAVPPTFVLPAGRISTSGQTVTFDLGNMINNDSDAGAETVVIEYNALTENISANNAGGILNNSFSVTINGGTPISSNTINVTVVEPSITFGKTIVSLPSPLDAGGVVQYRISYVNGTGANVSTAQEVNITDTLPVQLVLNLPVAVTLAGGAAGVTDSSAGNTLNVAIGSVPPGGSVIVDYTATIQDTVMSEQVITNTSNAIWTSLPGAGTAGNPTGTNTPGVSGASNGERNGSGGVNDYSSTSSRNFTIASPTISKQITATSESATNGTNVAIGEVVTYGILLTFPEGVTPADTVVDDLPTGLSVVSGTPEVITTAASSGGLLASDFSGAIGTQNITTVAGDGGSVTFNFANVVVSGDNVTTNNTILLRFTARVLNVIGNQNTDTLDNVASNQVGAGSPVNSNTVTVTVVEPELQLQKAVDIPAPRYQEVITYTITLSHLLSSAADAYDVTVTDALPSGLQYIAGSITAPAGWTTDVSDPANLKWRGDLSLVTGSVQFTYQAWIGDSTKASPGDTLTNNVNAVWSSLNGNVNSGQPEGERDGSGGINDYTTSTSHNVTYTNADLSITKDDGAAAYVPGGSLTYSIVVSNVGNGDILGATVSDLKLAEITSWVWTCSGASGGASGCDGAPLSAADFSDTVNLPAGSSITYSVTANIASSAAGNLTNTATISQPAGVIEPTPGNNTASDTDTQNSQADLSIAKDDGLTVISAGQIITYTVVVGNNGPSDAPASVVSDAIPPQITQWTWACSGATGGASGCNGAANSSTGFSDTVNLPAASSITYTVTAAVSPTASGTLTNTAVVSPSAGITDSTPGNNTATDTDTFATSAKTFLGSNQGFTGDPSVAIGEIVEYQVVLTVPQGSLSGLSLTDVLDRGLAFVNCDSITSSSPNLTTSISGGFAGICSNPTVSTEPSGSSNPADDGRKTVFDFGTLTNTDSADATLTVRYFAVMLDSLENQSGVSLTNSAAWNWTGGSVIGQAAPVTISEPKLALKKEAQPLSALPGGVITFTLTLNQTAESETPAFDVLLTDVLPTGLTYVPGSLRIVSGPSGGVPDETAAPILTVTWPAFPLLTGANRTEAVVEFQAVLGNLNRGQKVSNTANVSWTSLPGDVSVPQSAYNPLSTERFFDPLSAVNVYGVDASVTITVPKLPFTGFAPGVMTTLPEQPVSKAYQSLGDFWIEIPSLNVQIPIVGIPATENGWDLTWLADQAGWLEGTAYPTRAGNSAITAHVTTADGKPGPFADLNTLYWGRQIIIHLGGQRYIYEVRSVRVVLPDDLSILKHEESPVLTLITCKDYDAAANSYLRRVAVQAVLVKVESDTPANSGSGK